MSFYQSPYSLVLVIVCGMEQQVLANISHLPSPFPFLSFLTGFSPSTLLLAIFVLQLS